MTSGAVLFSRDPKSLRRRSANRRVPVTGQVEASEFDLVTLRLPGPLAPKPGRFPAANTAHAKLSLSSFAVPAGAEAAGASLSAHCFRFIALHFLRKRNQNRKPPYKGVNHESK
jgi:hypothetical protein